MDHPRLIQLRYNCETYPQDIPHTIPSLKNKLHARLYQTSRTCYRRSRNWIHCKSHVYHPHISSANTHHHRCRFASRLQTIIRNDLHHCTSIPPHPRCARRQPAHVLHLDLGSAPNVDQHLQPNSVILGGEAGCPQLSDAAPADVPSGGSLGHTSQEGTLD